MNNIYILFNNKLLNISSDNFALNNLQFYSQISGISKNIYELSITKDYIIITYEKSLSNCNNTKNYLDDVITNNIDAYDWTGNRLWNIADIVGDLKIPYFGGSVTTKEIMKKHYGFDESKYDNSCELFCCSAFNDHLYIIDLNSRKLVQVLETR